MFDLRRFSLIAGVFLFFYYLPVDPEALSRAFRGGISMLHDYAREHVLLCLVPAFFVAGTISTMLRKEAVLSLLGPEASRFVSYPVAALSGGVLAVCSCTILPIFAGIHRRGAGIGPAATFLFAGPAINVAAFFLTARVLGFELGLARLLSTLSAAVLIGLAMELLFRERGSGGLVQVSSAEVSPLKGFSFFALQMAFLVLGGLRVDPQLKAGGMALLALAVASMASFGFRREETRAWLLETWDLASKMLPYLFAGVFLAGAMAGLLPRELVVALLGRNDLVSTLAASVVGALTYFATLTEVPVVQALRSLGMADGPTLSLLMAGNSLSLPSMIVITSLLGRRRAFSYFALVVAFSALMGFAYGKLTNP